MNWRTNSAEWARLEWGTFWHNYSWADYTSLLNGLPSKAAVAVPLIGYAIIFNDFVSQHLTFETISGGSEGGFLHIQQRLQLMYIGLLLLAAANLVYRVVRPSVLRISEDQFEYISIGLNYFDFSYYLQIHSEVRRDDNFTPAADYYDTEWEGFLRLARGQGEGTGDVKQSANWRAARERYEYLMRGLLGERWFRSTTGKRKWLSACLAISLSGYGLLSVVSLDFFFRVVTAMA